MLAKLTPYLPLLTSLDDEELHLYLQRASPSTRQTLLQPGLGHLLPAGVQSVLLGNDAMPQGPAIAATGDALVDQPQLPTAVTTVLQDPSAPLPAVIVPQSQTMRPHSGGAPDWPRDVLRLIIKRRFLLQMLAPLDRAGLNNQKLLIGASVMAGLAVAAAINAFSSPAARQAGQRAATTAAAGGLAVAAALGAGNASSLLARLASAWRSSPATRMLVLAAIAAWGLWWMRRRAEAAVQQLQGQAGDAPARPAAAMPTGGTRARSSHRLPQATTPIPASASASRLQSPALTSPRRSPHEGMLQDVLAQVQAATQPVLPHAFLSPGRLTAAYDASHSGMAAGASGAGPAGLSGAFDAAHVDAALPGATGGAATGTANFLLSSLSPSPALPSASPLVSRTLTFPTPSMPPMPAASSTTHAGGASEQRALASQSPLPPSLPVTLDDDAREATAGATPASALTGTGSRPAGGSISDGPQAHQAYREAGSGAASCAARTSAATPLSAVQFQPASASRPSVPSAAQAVPVADGSVCLVGPDGTGRKRAVDASSSSAAGKSGIRASGRKSVSAAGGGPPSPSEADVDVDDEGSGS